MKRTIIDTKDNSKTLLIENTDVTYHSRHGAITESNHIFIEHGLKNLQNRTSAKVFEMGFGTGLNALLSLEYAIANKIKIDYHSIEKFPLSTIEINALTGSYSIEQQNHFKNIHQSPWDTNNKQHEWFTLKKIKEDVVIYQPQDNFYDIVFFDAFGPKFQPNLWEKNILTKMFACLKKGGILTTYCAQGQFKRDLITVGFQIENLPGPPGKREITRAIRP